MTDRQGGIDHNVMNIYHVLKVFKTPPCPFSKNVLQYHVALYLCNFCLVFVIKKLLAIQSLLGVGNSSFKNQKEVQIT